MTDKPHNAIHRMEPVTGVLVELQPGDMTRYEFLIVGDSVIDLIKNVRHEFDDNYVQLLREMAPEVVSASYEGYSLAVERNEWVCKLRDHAPTGTNPWTYLAALVALVRVRETL